MLPQQLLADTDVLGYFESISFLCLACEAEVLRAGSYEGTGNGSNTQEIEAAVDRRRQFNEGNIDAACSTDDVHTIDATRSTPTEVESDVHRWMQRNYNTRNRGTRV